MNVKQNFHNDMIRLGSPPSADKLNEEENKLNICKDKVNESKS